MFSRRLFRTTMLRCDCTSVLHM